MNMTVMSMSPGLRNVLDILADLAYNDTESDVSESNIISQSGIPKSEVQIYFGASPRKYDPDLAVQTSDCGG